MKYGNGATMTREPDAEPGSVAGLFWPTLANGFLLSVSDSHQIGPPEATLPEATLPEATQIDRSAWIVQTGYVVGNVRTL